MNGTLGRVEGDIWALDVGGDLRDEDVAVLKNSVDAIDRDARCVVLCGGDPIFNSGAARSHLLKADRSLGDSGADLCRLLLRIPVPTIAAMEGHAIGGGLVLGLWCDVLLFARESLYGTNFMALGFTPGMGATVALEEIFGRLLADEMLYAGHLLSGAELLSRGAPLPYVLPRAQVIGQAMEIARRICGPSARSARLLRSTLAARRRRRLEVALANERLMHRELFSFPETLRTICEQLPEM